MQSCFGRHNMIYACQITLKVPQMPSQCCNETFLHLCITARLTVKEEFFSNWKKCWLGNQLILFRSIRGRRKQDHLQDVFVFLTKEDPPPLTLPVSYRNKVRSSQYLYCCYKWRQVVLIDVSMFSQRVGNLTWGSLTLFCNILFYL